MSKLQRLLRPFRTDPAWWAAGIVVSRVLDAMRHSLVSAAVGAADLRIGRGSTLRGLKHVRFGRSFHARGAVWIEAVCGYGSQSFTPMITIGDNVSASDDLHITCIDRISIGNGVLFGSRVFVSDHNHGRYRGQSPSSPDEPPAQRELGGGGPVTIEDNAWMGDNVIIVGPVVIGKSAVVGANSVVRGDVAAFTMVAGIPAVPIKAYNFETSSWSKVPR